MTREDVKRELETFADIVTRETLRLFDDGVKPQVGLPIATAIANARMFARAERSAQLAVGLPPGARVRTPQ